MPILFFGLDPIYWLLAFMFSIFGVIFWAWINFNLRTIEPESEPGSSERTWMLILLIFYTLFSPIFLITLLLWPFPKVKWGLNFKP